MKGKLKAWLILIAALIVLFPGFRLLYVYIKNYNRSYAIEFGKDVVTRYSFDPKSTNAFLSGDVQGDEFGSKNVEESASQMETYYEEVFKEYGMDKEIVDAYRQNQTRGAEDNIYNQTPELGGNDESLIGDMKNLRVLNAFTDRDETKLKEGTEEEKAVEDFDKEAENLDLYINEDYIKSISDKYYRSPGDFILSESKSFEPSPPPTKNKNKLDILEKLKISTSKNSYFSFEPVRYNIVSPESVNIDDLRVYVIRNGYVIPNIDGRKDYFVNYKNKAMYGAVILGYRPSPGVYDLVVKSLSNPTWEGIKTSFKMQRRAVPPVQKGFSVVNMEYTTPLDNRQIIGPYGEKGGVEKIADWLKFIDTDAFWTLTAQTTGWDNSLSNNKPWVYGGFRNLALTAPYMHDRGIKVGAYAMSFYTPANGKKRISDYKPSLGYSVTSDAITDSLHVSLLDEKRIKDLTQFARDMDANPNVDFIGFDFIRTGEVDGYEMVDLVVDDMNISKPSGFDDYNFSQKVRWFGKQIKVYKNSSIIAKWRWWRASRVATIINHIIVDGGIRKPLWVFTLGWEHGWQHGQDPYMMFDAGVLIDSAMLYEASENQFANLMVQWHSYMRDNNNNIFIGNSSDRRLVDSTIRNTATEFIYRNRRGYQEIYHSGLSKGVFLHDISRALWSRNRGLSTLEWAIVYGHSVSAFRQESGVIPYYVKLSHNGEQGITLTIKNKSTESIKGIQAQIIPTLYWSEVKDNIPSSIDLNPGEEKSFSVYATIKPDYRNSEGILAYKITHHSYRDYFVFTQNRGARYDPYIYDNKR